MFSLIYRGELDPTTEGELENLVSRMKALWLIEHNDDGTHGDINARSANFDGNVTINGTLDVTGKGTYGGSLQLADVADGLYGHTGGYEVKFVTTTTSNTLGPSIKLDTTTTKGWSIVADGLHSWRALKFFASAEPSFFDCAMQLSSDFAGTLGTYYLRPNGVAGILNLGGPVAVFGPGSLISNIYCSGTVFTLSVDCQQVAASSGYYEEGRGTPLGWWVTQPYAAGNFTTGSAAVWTVAPGNVQQYSYSLVGKTMHLQYAFLATSLNAGTSNLTIAIPGGFSTPSVVYGTGRSLDPGIGVWTVCLAEATGAVVNFYSTVGGGGWSASAGGTYIQGHMSFQVN